MTGSQGSGSRGDRKEFAVLRTAVNESILFQFVASKHYLGGLRRMMMMIEGNPISLS